MGKNRNFGFPVNESELRGIIKRGFCPALYAQDGRKNKLVYFIMEGTKINWKWYVTEAELSPDGLNATLFGYVEGFENEFGYFNLREVLKETQPEILILFPPQILSKLLK